MGWGEQVLIRAAFFPLRMLSGPVQHFESVILEAWQLKVSTQSAERQRFRGAQFLDLRGSLQIRSSSHLRERDEVLLRVHFVWRVGGFRTGFILSKSRKDEVLCRFCVKSDGDGHQFWERTFPPIMHAVDRGDWPRCLLWHGWLPGLGIAGVRDSWASWPSGLWSSVLALTLLQCCSAEF